MSDPNSQDFQAPRRHHLRQLSRPKGPGPLSCAPLPLVYLS